jgi:hypothetical protein
MAASDVSRRFDLIAESFDPVTLIVAPPRSCSTALARVFWSLSNYRFYSHEPFEVAYYEGADLERVAALLADPPEIVDLDPSRREESSTSGLLIKEMTFQVGADFPLLLGLATGPVIFLIRDPRLCVVSRMRALSRQGRPPIFDPAESGWAQLVRQIDETRRRGAPYVVVEAHSFRCDPSRVVGGLAEALGFTYSDRLLQWQSSGVGSLSVMHQGLDDPFYDRVLHSRGIEPPIEQVPALREIPEERGLRQHVEEALETFNELQSIAIGTS